MSLDNLLIKIQEFLKTKSPINPDAELITVGFDSLNIMELILICESLYPDFNYNENFIFHKEATLREIYNQIASDKMR